MPRPIDQARHCLVMELLDAFPMRAFISTPSKSSSNCRFRRQLKEISSPGKLYSSLMDIIVRLANVGLIHGDFNEFNIMIHRETGEPIIIDFPQMVSTSHANAEW